MLIFQVFQPPKKGFKSRLLGRTLNDLNQVRWGTISACTCANSLSSGKASVDPSGKKKKRPRTWSYSLHISRAPIGVKGRDQAVRLQKISKLIWIQKVVWIKKRISMEGEVNLMQNWAQHGGFPAPKQDSLILIRSANWSSDQTTSSNNIFNGLANNLQY